MPYLMMMGWSDPPEFEIDTEYWKESWGSQYERLLPFSNGESVDKKLIPKSAVTNSDPKNFPSFLPLPYWLCDDDIMSNIETMEPEKHKFFDFHIRNLQDKENFRRYNLLQICVSIPAIIPEKSDPKLIYFSQHENVPENRKHILIRRTALHVENSGISLNKELISGHHLWIEERISGGSGLPFASDEFREMIMSSTAGKLVNFFEVKEVDGVL